MHQQHNSKITFELNDNLMNLMCGVVILCFICTVYNSIGLYITHKSFYFQLSVNIQLFTLIAPNICDLEPAARMYAHSTPLRLSTVGLPLYLTIKR